MSHRVTIRHLALLAAGAAIGALAVVAPNAGANSAPPRHVTTVNHLSLDASAFVPDGLHTTTSDYYNHWDPQSLSNQDGSRCFDAPLTLPSGATIKRVTFFYTAGSASMYVELNRQNLANNTDAILLTFTSTTGSTTYTSTTKGIAAGMAVVNNLSFAYSFGLCPSATTTFTGLVVTYTTTT